MKCTAFFLCLLPLATTAFVVYRSPIIADVDTPDVYSRDPLTGALYDPRDRSFDDNGVLLMNRGPVTRGFARPGSMLSRFPLKNTFSYTMMPAGGVTVYSY